MNQASIKDPTEAASATGDCGQTPPPSTCCELTCFDRPRYFCGHLLTDEDLSLGQKYLIEKNKMYHRSLHGQGIVCGLRLTCDTKCCGRIIVDKGFAIDDCGNDLVVCDPITVDVLAILREKGYLVAPGPSNECEPVPPEERCKTHQCFYVTICYDETQKDFTTPFVPSCGTAVTDCEATRIHEGVRFDVISELPAKDSYLHELEERVKHCYRLFQRGPFAEQLRRGAEDLRRLCAEEGEQYCHPRYSEYHELFCALRWYFLLYLKEHPDKYNCRMEEEVRCLSLRHPSHCDEGRSIRYEEVREAFCKLLQLANQYVMSCVTGEMIFRCPEHRKASCVVLGTVEIEDGELVRVCNCPRSYVWSFASIPQVFIAELLGGLACESEPESGEGSREKHRVCCREFELDCCDFLKCFESRQDTLHLGSTSVLRWAKTWWSSLRHAFSFDRRDVFPCELVQEAPIREAEEMLKCLGVKHRIVESKEASAARFTPFGFAQTLRMPQYGDTMELQVHGGRVVAAEAAGEIDQLRAHVDTMNSEISRTRERNDALQAQIERLQVEIEEIKGSKRRRPSE